ncbi:MAG: TolC family protein [Candidatus Edwardsbacteria bacterium]|nr:TolC family protein [Candidatus Edwardsbacteria bacterium]
MKNLFLVLMLSWVSASMISAQPADQLLTVEQCVEMALKQSPDMVRAQSSLTIAGAGLQTSVSGILPHINASSSYGQSGPATTYDAFYNAVEGGKNESYRTSLSASQSVVNLSQWADILGSYRSRQAAKSGYQQAMASLVYNVKAAYYNLVKLQKAMEVAEASVKQSEEQSKQAKLMYQLGSISQADMLKIQVRLMQSKIDLLNAQSAQLTGRQTIANILGLAGEVRVGSEVAFPDTTQQAYTIESLDDKTIESNPGYLSAQKNHQAKKSSAWAAYLSKLPSLSFSYSYGYSDSMQFTNSDSWNAHDYWNASLALSWNIFDGTASMARIRQARAQARAAEADMISARQSVYSELKQAQIGLKTAKEAVALVGDLLQQASEDYRLTNEKYKLGSASVLDLLTSQLTYNQAQQQATNALCEYYLAEARTAKALGRW